MGVTRPRVQTTRGYDVSCALCEGAAPKNFVLCCRVEKVTPGARRARTRDVLKLLPEGRSRQEQDARNAKLLGLMAQHHSERAVEERVRPSGRRSVM